MFDEIFEVFVWSGKDIKHLEEIVYQGVWRVIGDSGIEEFKRKMFSYAYAGYNVDFNIMRK